MITTCSCSTWLCSTLARIASGAVSLAAVEEHRRARDAQQRRLPVASSSTNSRSGPSACSRARGDDLAAALPGRHHGERDDADQQRQPCAVDQLGHVRGEEQQIDQQQRAAADARTSHSGVRHLVRAK